ncbi:MAG: HD domain-containing phosphohydrolase [Pseudomonadota bacterium]
MKFLVEILRAVASQAAVSLQKNVLLRDINQLFESFVQASVKTIEQRDPATSGHSFRVAETTVALLQALPQSSDSRFKNLQFSNEHIREVRYAALLHDFGKIGVPEAILIKANKLTDERLEVIQYRIELQKERLRRRAVEQELDLLHHMPVDQEVARRRVHRQLEKQLGVLDQYFEWIERASNPNILDAGEYDHLNEIRDYAFRELDGTVGGVITDEDLLALSVRRGSLTPAERRAIQSHVVYTKEFLSVLPWPPELAQVPEIAGGHHERLDGSGYPAGLVGEQIPLASRVMAVCDVYDALTAMDRPYKPAMGKDTAFDILHDEARRGLLDEEMVNIFIASGSYELAKVG